MKKRAPLDRFRRPANSAWLPFHHGNKVPAGFEPARSREWDHRALMYSNRAVEKCLEINRDRRRVDQSLYGALPLSYGARLSLF